MQADEVGTLDEIIDTGRFLDLRWQAPGRVDGNLRVQADNVHAKLDGCFRQHRADGAEADDAQRTAAQFVPDKILFSGLDLFVQRLVIALQSAYEADRGKYVARSHQHAGNDQFLDCIGVGSGGVEHDDAAFAHGLDRDVVGAGAGATDGQYAGRDGQLMHDLGAHQNGVRVGTVIADDIAFGKSGKPFLRNGVECLNFAGHACFLV